MLAIDIGSSGVRAALYDARGRVVRGSEVRRGHSTQSGEADADRIIEAAEHCVTESLQRTGGEIAGVGVSTFWHGLVAATAGGDAITPLYLWNDTRGGAAAERLRARLDEEGVRQRTGCPIHASYWPAKIAWLRETRPELARRRPRWLSLGDLWFTRLFGRTGTSLSMASGTGLFRLDEPLWDEEMCAALGIGMGSLPPIAESDRGLREPYRKRWPRLTEVPWFHALGDGALANLGSGCMISSRRSVTVGTSAAVRVMQRAPVRKPIPRGLWRYRLDSKRVITGAALSAGGNVRDWLLRTVDVEAARLEKALATRSLGTHGLTFVPNLAGERSPGYAPDATGSISGLTLATTAEDFARAGAEAVIVAIARVNRLLDGAAPRAVALVASGNALIASPAWMQLLADACGTPVEAGRAAEASSRGAALFVLERLGLARASPAYIGATRTFRPRKRA